MKSYGAALAILALVSGSFLAGAWYSRSTTISAKSAPAVRPALYAVGANGGSDVDQAYAATTAPMPAGTVHVPYAKQQLIGVRIGEVEMGSGTFTRRILGRVAPDETRLYRLNVAVDGWVQETFSVTVGSLVTKDQPLLSFYSPEFLGPLQAYFYALGALDRYQESGREPPAQIVLTKNSIQQAVDSLKNLGMGDLQIEELKRTRQPTQRVIVRAPATGFVIARNVSPGQRLERGAEVYRIADLRHVWILVDIFENEADYFRPGAVAKVSLPYQKKSFDGRVSDVLPQFDPVSRSLKMRLDADNPRYLLWPDMFVDVDLPVRLPPAVTVPVDAVLESGLKKTVFVDRGNGFFEPRTVETGWSSGGRVEVIRGLAPGEPIVIAGTFLIDSESRMRQQDPAMTGVGGGHHHDDHHAAPTTPAHDVARPMPADTITAHDGHGAHHHD